jgi:hypothetical protein
LGKSLCLSQACLGKSIGFIHINSQHNTPRVSAGPDGNLTIASLDAPVLSTGILSPFPTPGDNTSIPETLIQGMHWNVENNVWNVDYPQVHTRTRTRTHARTHTHVHAAVTTAAAATTATSLAVSVCLSVSAFDMTLHCNCTPLWCMQWYPFEGVYGYGNGGVVDRTLGTDASVKTVFFSHLYMETIFLPRQARDKHRENSESGLFS